MASCFLQSSVSARKGGVFPSARALSLGSLLAASAPTVSDAFWHGIAGTQNIYMSRDLGANAIRTWGEDQLTPDLLSCGHGMDILAGLNLVPNEDAGAAAARIVASVQQFGSSGCIKGWIIGNELETHMDSNAAFSLINYVAGAIKNVDPGRLTMSATAGSGEYGSWCKRLRCVTSASHDGAVTRPLRPSIAWPADPVSRPAVPTTRLRLESHAATVSACNHCCRSGGATV